LSACADLCFACGNVCCSLALGGTGIPLPGAVEMSKVPGFSQKNLGGGAVQAMAY
jgi:hypothetical protein